MKKQVMDEPVSREARQLTLEEEAVGNVGLSRVMLILAGIDFFLAVLALLYLVFLWNSELAESAGYAGTENDFAFALSTMIFTILGVAAKLTIFFICRKTKGQPGFIKYAYIIIILTDCFIIDVLGFGYSFLFLLPVIISMFYYIPEFTKRILLIDEIFYLAAEAIIAAIGPVSTSAVKTSQDVLIRKGETISSVFTDRTLLDSDAYFTNYLFVNVFPQMLLILVIGLVCIVVAKRGQAMTRRQNLMVKKTTAIETELNVAAGIQLSMVPNEFPAFPDKKQFDIYAMMEPAKNVGGDFYDYYFIDDDHLALVMADVCGKGMPAALFMSRARTCLQDHLSSLDLSLTEAVNRTNRMMIKNNPSMTFITAWIGVLDIHTGDLAFINAGHTQPILLDRAGNLKDFTYDSNLMIGATKFKYVQDSIKLEPGDRLFLCTDGIYEAHIMNGDDDIGLKDEMLFGRDRAVEVLRANMGKSVEESVRLLKMWVDDYVQYQAQFDDITMLYLSYLGDE